MCFFNNCCGCGRRAGSCFSRSSSAAAEGNLCGACNASDFAALPYYVNPCGWYTGGAYAVIALVSTETSALPGRSCCGCR